MHRTPPGSLYKLPRTFEIPNTTICKPRSKIKKTSETYKFPKQIQVHDNFNLEINM
jgi:hypothetical protein